jgi:hypothetical protein
VAAYKPQWDLFLKLLITPGERREWLFYTGFAFFEQDRSILNPAEKHTRLSFRGYVQSDN